MKEFLGRHKDLFVPVLLIIVLGFAVYGNSLGGKFLWDDDCLVKGNIHLRGWSNLPRIFSEDMGTGGGARYHFYRPLLIFSYLVDYSLWKLNVVGYHLTNTLLHILAVLAIYWLVNLLYEDRLLSLLASMFFVVHPVHTEVVSYISGRADILVLLFMLLSFIFYLKSSRSKIRGTYILMVLSCICAFLSKESTVTLPLLLLLYHFTFRKKIRLTRFLPIVAITGLYILLKASLSGSSLAPVSSLASLFRRIPGFFVAFTNYLRLMLVPFNLHMEYGNKLFRLTESRAMLGAAILLSLVVYLFKERKNRGLIFFSASWFFLTLLPVSNTLFPLTFYMAERWLYLPSIGFFLILAKLFTYLYRTRNLRILALLLTAALLSFYSYLTIRQNNYWREPLTFYERTLEYAPDSARIHNNLGIIYHRMGREEEAVALFRKALEIDPDYPEAYNNLGNASNALGKREEALALYKKALEIDPDFALAHNNLGNAYAILGKREEALASYKKAIEADPNYAEAYYSLGNAYSGLGKTEDALALFKKTVELNPYHPGAHYNLGNAYSSLGKSEEALASYKKAIEINPDEALAYNNLGNAYSSLGRGEEALASYKKAIEINSDYPEAYYNLGTVYTAMGKREEAIGSYKKAVEINPADAMAHKELALIYYHQKRYDRAIKHYDRAIELGYESDPEFLKHLEPYRKLGSDFQEQ
jgi:tetratricopeptide (TPR) repeat protein